MIDTIKKELCTGCNACYNICPRDCIHMEEDNTGFKYPKINYDKCIRCKQCIKVCPSLNKLSLDKNWSKPKVFAAWSLDEKIRFNSSSGGIFSELAKIVLSKGGLVVGARYNKQNLVEHDIIESIENLEKLRQSKYVQSDIGYIFRKIEKELLNNRVVAFCGSPCQVAGLLRFLKKPYHNLITFDFVCRGANSPKAYLKYLKMLEHKYKSKIKRIWFRHKIYGWNRLSTRIDLKNGKTYIKDRYTDLYMRGYIEENLYMRPCCFNCKFKNFPRVADITLGDFWKIEASYPKIDSDKGISLVMINSDRGEDLFRSISNNIFYKKSTLNVALKGNPAIIKSSVKNPKSDIFMNMLDKYSFDVCFKKCTKNRFLKNIQRKVCKIKSKIKKIVSHWYM